MQNINNARKVCGFFLAKRISKRGFTCALINFPAFTWNNLKKTKQIAVELCCKMFLSFWYIRVAYPPLSLLPLLPRSVSNAYLLSIPTPQKAAARNEDSQELSSGSWEVTLARSSGENVFVACLARRPMAEDPGTGGKRNMVKNAIMNGSSIRSD